MSYIGSSPTSAAFVTDSFSGNATTTAFTMSVAPANPSSALVAISGILQDPTTYSVSGLTLTFSSAPPVGTGNISVRYLGIPASGVTTTAYRTVTEFTATLGQTTFTPPSYTVGYINVFRNGVRLGTADYTASNGTTVVLANAATVGDLVVTESFYVSSVSNAVPQSGGSITGALNVSGPLGVGTNSPSLTLNVKSPSDYRVALFETTSLAGPSVQIKGSKTYELRSTNTGAGEGAGLFFIYDKDNEASRLTINSSGYINLPYQPSFLAGSTAGDTTISSSAVVPFDSTGTSGYNIGNCYSTSTYKFTAPIAGKYLFNCIAYYTDSGSNTQTMQLAPLLNGSQVVVGGDAIVFHSFKPNAAGSVGAFGASVVLNLAQNDYVQVYARGTAARLYLGHTKFSGYLLG
jgi:hypothetical protein